MKKINVSVSFNLELLDEDYEWLLDVSDNHEIYHLIYDMAKEQCADAKMSICMEESNREIKKINDTIAYMSDECNRLSEF